MKPGLSKEFLCDFLEAKVREYNRPAFITDDPVSIPHLFSRKEDIEIAGFFAATIAWGQRPVIIRNARSLMERMDMAPYEFVLSASPKDLKKLDSFVHRTFNATDVRFFVAALRNIYKKHGGMECVFLERFKNSRRGAEDAESVRAKSRTSAPLRQKTPQDNFSPARNAIIHFREIFLTAKHDPRSEKHIANPASGSNAKRINMFLRWMVRKDNAGVDFGLWKSIPPSLLCCPLDVHVGNVARALGLLERKQDDWKAVEELTAKLREFDAEDPVKYDFALFGTGVFEKIVKK